MHINFVKLTWKRDGGRGVETWMEKTMQLAYAMRWKNGFENILGVLGLVCPACTQSTSGNMGVRKKN